MDKSLSNTNTADAVKTTPDVKVVGNPDIWQLICKASGKRWMKSTKKMIVYCHNHPIQHIIQVTSEFRDEKGNVTACAEALSPLLPGEGPIPA